MHLWRRCLWRINPTLILWRILDSGFLQKETASQPVRLFLSHYIKPGKTGTECIRTSSSWISSDFCRNCAPTKNFQLEKINFFPKTLKLTGDEERTVTKWTNSSFPTFLLDDWPGQWIYLDYWYCMEIGLLSTDSELAMALVRILYLLNGWNVEEIDSVSAELQWQFLRPGLINLYFLLWKSRDYLRPCSDRQPVSVNDSLRFLLRKAILISFSGKRIAANLFQNHFEFGKSLGAMDEKLQLLNL